MEDYLGMVSLFAGPFAPRGWLFCDGRTLQVGDYPQLFGIIGNIYGGDGSKTFCLPNLNGKIPIGMGQGKGLSNHFIGESGGNEKIALEVSHLPAHTHLVPASPAVGMVKIRISDTSADSPSGKNRAIAQAASKIPDYNIAPKPYDGTPKFDEKKCLDDKSIDISKLYVKKTETLKAGSNQDISLMQPTLALNFIICVKGLVPPTLTVE